MTGTFAKGDCTIGWVWTAAGLGTATGSAEACGVSCLVGSAMFAVGSAEEGGGSMTAVTANWDAVAPRSRNVARNSWADWNRSAGFFAIAIIMASLSGAGTEAATLFGANGVSFKCAAITA